MFLLIDNYDSFTYNIQQCIRAHGAEVEVFRNDQISLDEIENMSLDGIIISPGPGKPSDAGLCISIIKVAEKTIPEMNVLSSSRETKRNPLSCARSFHPYL